VANTALVGSSAYPMAFFTEVDCGGRALAPQPPLTFSAPPAPVPLTKRERAEVNCEDFRKWALSLSGKPEESHSIVRPSAEERPLALPPILPRIHAPQHGRPLISTWANEATQPPRSPMTISKFARALRESKEQPAAWAQALQPFMYERPQVATCGISRASSDPALLRESVHFELGRSSSSWKRVPPRRRAADPSVELKSRAAKSDAQVAELGSPKGPPKAPVKEVMPFTAVTDGRCGAPKGGLIWRRKPSSICG
jgi:hypothetical protein